MVVLVKDEKVREVGGQGRRQAAVVACRERRVFIIDSDYQQQQQQFIPTWNESKPP